MTLPKTERETDLYDPIYPEQKQALFCGMT